VKATNSSGKSVTIPINQLDKGGFYRLKTILKYQKEYDRGKHLIQFSKNNKVKEISCTGGYSCPKIASIGIDSTWKELIQIFGSPEYGYRDCDNGTRKVCYPKYNVCFALEKSKVYYISVVRKWNARDYYNYGKLITELHEQRNHAYAIKAFDKAIEIDQNNPKAYVAKGWELYQLGKYKEAVELYNKAISLDFTSANLYNYLGLALENLNKEREAIKAYEEAIKLDKKFQPPYSNIARIYASQKQYKKALEYINIGIGLQESGDLLSVDLSDKGRYLYELHHYDEAIKAYEESILSATSGMNKSYPYHGIGLCLLALGNKEEAIEAINKAIDLNPSYNDEFRKTLKSALGQ